jgi:hypothetical protein
MKSLAVVLLAALCIMLTAPVVQADPFRLPAAIYPPGAHLGFRPALTNAEMDCRWGFVCEGGYIPNFHLNTQDTLHRESGWDQSAGIQQRGRTTMAFELFVSRYDPVSEDVGITWSERAFLDLQAAVRAQGYLLHPRERHLLPEAHPGDKLVAVQYLGKQDLIVMAFWSGTLEIEGIALYDHRSPTAKQTAWTSLAVQFLRASQRSARVVRRERDAASSREQDARCTHGWSG